MGCRSFLAALMVVLVWPATALAEGLFFEVEILPDATSRASASAYDISTIEAERRAALEPALGDLYEELTSNMPAVVSGVWLDNTQKRWIRLAVASSATDGEQQIVVDLVDKAGLTDETEVTRRPVAMKDLLALIDEVWRRTAGDREVVSVGLEPQVPRVVGRD